MAKTMASLQAFPSSLLLSARSRALIPFPFPFERLPRSFQRFPSVTCLRTRVWNWSQNINYINATPRLKPDETGFMFDCWMQCSIFDCSIVKVFVFQTFDCVRLAEFLSEFDCVRSPNPIEVNRTIGLRLGSTTERSILPSPCTASFQALSVNAFRWRIRDERLGDA